MADQPLNMDVMYNRLRSAILDGLRKYTQQRQKEQLQVRQGTLRQLLPEQEIRERDVEKLDRLVCQIHHELYLERIIIPGTAHISGGASQSMEWPHYCLTDYGRRALETREYSPYDPNGYLRRLKEDIPDVDETIFRYVEESLRCLRMDCLLAAAVTIGCASEKAMLLLIERFGQAISDQAKKRSYEKSISDWRISKKCEVFRSKLGSVTNDLPKELVGPLELHLDGIFDLIRKTRNAAGHPTGDPITREIIHARHTVFPGFCKYVYALMHHFAKTPVNL